MPKRRGAWWIAAGLAAALGAGIVALFGGAPILGRRLPPLFSMRADGIGTKLYFDSLQAAGGVGGIAKYKTLAEAPERDANHPVSWRIAVFATAGAAG